MNTDMNTDMDTDMKVYFKGFGAFLMAPLVYHAILDKDVSNNVTLKFSSAIGLLMITTALIDNPLPVIENESDYKMTYDTVSYCVKTLSKAGIGVSLIWYVLKY